MSNTIYLYLKTHNITGLKYLGKTVKDPFKYNGSGKHWLRHLNKHGNDITTEILFETEEMEEFKKVAHEYNKKWNIVESRDFANLMEETGTGGDNSHNIDYVRLGLLKRGNTWELSEESKKNHSSAAKKYWDSEKSDKHRKMKYNGSKKEIKDKFVGPACPGRIRITNANLLCPHCNKIGDAGNMKRWHFDKCKNR